jgi:hypothetical protein
MWVRLHPHPASEPGDPRSAMRCGACGQEPESERFYRSGLCRGAARVREGRVAPLSVSVYTDKLGQGFGFERTHSVDDFASACVFRNDEGHRLDL